MKPFAAVIATVAALSCGGSAAADLRPLPQHPIDLSGHWVANNALSDDSVALAKKWAEKYLVVRRPRPMTREEEEDLALPDDEHTMREPPSEDHEGGRREDREQRPPRINFSSEHVRQLLAMVSSIDIAQNGATIDIRSELDADRYEAGSRSQVSIPEGGLADSNVGWHGDTLVITRHVPRGLSVSEEYRLSKNGEQLEYKLERRGEGLFSPLTIRRVFERGAPARENFDSGPAR